VRLGGPIGRADWLSQRLDVLHVCKLRHVEDELQVVVFGIELELQLTSYFRVLVRTRTYSTVVLFHFVVVQDLVGIRYERVDFLRLEERSLLGVFVHPLDFPQGSKESSFHVQCQLGNSALVALVEEILHVK
jgi:hypothetical protein